MILRAYSCYDKAVKAFMTPFFCRSDAEAVRSFRDACNDANHQFAKHAVDFSLFCVGEFDDTLGAMTIIGPTKVVDALALVSPEGV